MLRYNIARYCGARHRYEISPFADIRSYAGIEEADYGITKEFVYEVKLSTEMFPGSTYICIVDIGCYSITSLLFTGFRARFQKISVTAIQRYYN
jgi:hypothetical protein